MKKIIALFLFFCAVGQGSVLEAQNIRFGKYFEDMTLRINYHRIGNRQSDTIRVLSEERICVWPGSLTQLVDPCDNGD